MTPLSQRFVSGVCVSYQPFLLVLEHKMVSAHEWEKKKKKTKTFSLFTKGGRKAQPLLLSDACGASSLCG